MIVRELFAKLGIETDSAAFKNANGLITGLTGAFKNLAVIAGGTALVAGLYKLTKTFADAGDNAFKTSQKIGVGVEALQELQYAAKLADVSSEQLSVGLGFLSKQAYEAANGGSEAQENFKALGVSFKGADGQIRPTEDLLLSVSDTIAAMPDGVKKTALMMRLFGRSGKDLIPFMNAGSKGIAAMMKEAKALGIVIDEQTAKKAEEFNDNLTRLSASVTGVAYAFGNRLMNALIPVVEGLVSLAKHSKKWIDAIAPLFVPVLAAIAIAFIALKASAIAAAIATVAAWVVALLPFILLVAAIALVILWIEDLYAMLNGEENVSSKIFGAMSEGVSEALDFWKKLIFKFWDWVVEKFKTLGSVIADGMKSGAKAAIEFLPGGQFLSNKIFGGGESPGAAANTSGPVTTNNVSGAPKSFSANVTVNAQTGANPQEIAKSIDETMRGFNADIWSEASAAVGGG